MEVEVIQQPSVQQRQFSATDTVFSVHPESGSGAEGQSPDPDRVDDDWTSPNPVKGNKRNRRKGAGGTRHVRILLNTGNNGRQRPYPEFRTQNWKIGRERKQRKKIPDEFEKPRAPYNTTQFLMDYHENASDQDGDADSSLAEDSRMSPKFTAHRVRTRTVSECCGSSATRNRSPTLSLPLLGRTSLGQSDDSSIESECSPDVPEPGKGEVSTITPNFEEVDFSKTYNNIHIESLFDMSKKDLVKEVLSLEKRANHLEARIEILAAPAPKDLALKSVDTDSKVEQSKDKIQIDRSFIKCLQQEICQLQQENRKLKSQN